MLHRIRGTLGLFKHLRTRYGFTIFLSAFLLFQIQPMIGRSLLPSFGGSVAVWGTSLVFFTTALFVGYLYVYLISTLSSRAQARIHVTAISAALVWLCGVYLFTGSLYMPIDWVFGAAQTPSLQVLLGLFATIGVPYFLLSTTGPLLQHWYAREKGEEPYHLYALSNLGSFLALGTYPFLIEPGFGLGAQQGIWMFFFLICAVLLIVITRSSHAHEEKHRGAAEVISLQTLASWLGFAALPAALLVATTARITQVIAPIPFLWVVPLALYLLSFILAFRGWGAGALTPFLALVSAAASFIYLEWSFADFSRQAVANLALLYFGSLYCHALLYKLRPSAHSSSFYYVWTALGGAVGTLLMSMIAPLLFVDFLEFLIAVAVLAALAVKCFPARTYLRDEYHKNAAGFKGALVAIILLLFNSHLENTYDDSIYRSRNFYGQVRVTETEEMRNLYHSTTLHGTQFMDAERFDTPTTYYSPTSGVGRALVYTQSNNLDRTVKVAVVGLGTGTLASYCFDSDLFTFYEIDPRIEEVARTYFSYLDSCAGAEVRYGDGRLNLERELKSGIKGEYDVMAIDAFSDDTVPVHLLTKEAVELYFAHMRDDNSILAIHTSNRYLELSPVVMRVAIELGLSAMVIEDYGEGEGATTSQWVLLSKNAEVFADKLFVEAASEPPTGGAPLWTDDYANVFATVDLSALRLWEEEYEE